jgi:hypothetical protein
MSDDRGQFLVGLESSPTIKRVGWIVSLSVNLTMAVIAGAMRATNPKENRRSSAARGSKAKENQKAAVRLEPKGRRPTG